jgi:hypothetical protein
VQYQPPDAAKLKETAEQLRARLEAGANALQDSDVSRQVELLVLGEVNAHPIFRTPNDGAGQMQGIFRDNQGEFCRDTDRAGYLQQGSGGRQVANHAIDCDAAEFNLGGFLDAVTSRNPCFDHLVEI